MAKQTDCNCIEHFCCGYEAGKRVAMNRPNIVRMSHSEVFDIAAFNVDRRYEGNYAVTVYHRDGTALFSGTKTWMLALEILTERCGVNITRLTFVADDVKTYEYGLVED